MADILQDFDVKRMMYINANSAPGFPDSILAIEPKARYGDFSVLNFWTEPRFRYGKNMNFVFENQVSNFMCFMS